MNIFVRDYKVDLSNIDEQILSKTRWQMVQKKLGPVHIYKLVSLA